MALNGSTHVSSDESLELRRTVRLPLNSRRLTASQLKRVGAALELPTAASTDEVRQIIEGKLSRDSHEPSSVQVVFEPSGALALHDENGEFVRKDPEIQEDTEAHVETGESQAGSEEVDKLRDALQKANDQITELQLEVENPKAQVNQGKVRIKEIWQKSCEELLKHDEELAAKDKEIAALRKGHSAIELQASDSQSVHSEATIASSSGQELRKRAGRAPPIDYFTGESPEVLLEDWVPLLERAATWNGWTEEEKLLQLAGYLRGRARQEWMLLADDNKKCYATAIETLKNRLDFGRQALATQDFRHLRQEENENVSDFIRKLEHTFKLAYGRDPMLRETRAALLYGQMQNGSKDELMAALAVSGAQNCVCQHEMRRSGY